MPRLDQAPSFHVWEQLPAKDLVPASVMHAGPGPPPRSVCWNAASQVSVVEGEGLKELVQRVKPEDVVPSRPAVTKRIEKWARMS